MRFLRNFCAASLAVLLTAEVLSAQDFRIIQEGYFRNKGVDVMAFYDSYPDSSHYLFLVLATQALLQ